MVRPHAYADRAVAQSAAQPLPEPAPLAAAFADPAGHGVGQVVAALRGGSDLARLALPDGVVAVPGADDRVGDLVQQSVLDVGPRRPQAVAHRHVDARFPVAADARARPGEIEAERPLRAEAALRLVTREQAPRQRLDVSQGALPFRNPLDDIEESIGHLPPALVAGQHHRANGLQLGHHAGDRLAANREPHPAAGGSRGAGELGSDGAAGAWRGGPGEEQEG